MDFSLASFESRVGPTQSRPESGGPSDYHHQQQQQQQQQHQEQQERSVVGSGYAKQQRPELEEHERRISKLAKTIDLSPAHPNKPTLLMQFPQGGCSDNFVNPLPRSDKNNISVVFSSDNALNQHAQMLSFSSRKPVEANIAPSNLALPYYQRMPPSLYSRYAGGYGGGGRLKTSMHGDYSRIRGPFTPSQWIELEHQALIYKYLSSNVPVPSHLLLPLKNSLSPFSLASSSLSPLSPKSWWGSLQLGYSDNTDPEPGRCRRTDGKKWRCSRDAVADQKYCDRHINRGRPRSRKPVEGQTGHAATGTDAATTSSVEVPPPITSSVSTTMSSALPVGGSSNSLTTITTSTTDAPLVNRMQDLGGLSVMSSSSTVNLKSDEFTFDILNQEIITPEESSRSEFGLVSTVSLLNPSQESSYIDSKSYDASPFPDFIGQDTGDQYQLRHFIDVWPNDTSEHSAIAWPAELKSDWTKLSMSIPMTSSGFSSSSNSSKHKDNLVLSPLRLSREFEPTLMSLAGSDYLAQNEIKWVPTSWAAASDCSVGGPLGEALTNSSGYEKAYKNYPSSSSLNLLTDGLDGSPQVGSSPTGVLQKSTFCSLSNSSSESSPRVEYKRNYIVGASIYDDVLGTPLASTSVPFL